MSLYYLTLIGLIGFFMSLLALILQHKHLLSILLSLEAMTMNLFILVFSFMNATSSLGQASLILITLSACEASLALSMLVSVIRVQGNDYVYSFSIQQC